MMRKYEGGSFVAALGGFPATFVHAIFTALIFGCPTITVLFITMTLSPISVSVISMTILELGKVRTKVGR